MTTTTTLKGEHEAFVSAFLRQVRRDPDLPSSGYRVAAEIAEHLNRRSRTAWPCQARLIANTGLSEATVKRALGLLRSRGYLDLEPGEGRRSTVYRLLIVDRAGSPMNPLNTGAEGSEMDARRVHRRPLRGFTGDPRPYEGPSEGTPKASPYGERDARAREAPDISARRCRAAEIEEGRKAAADRPSGNTGRGARGDHPEAIQGEIIPPVGGFQDLLAVYHRPWGEDHALASRRYADARREVGHAAIMEGARRWAEVYLADNGGLQFMKPLDHWLAQRLWREAPPRRWKAVTGAAATGKARKPRKADYDPVAGAKRVAAKIIAERAAWDASCGWAGFAGSRR